MGYEGAFARCRAFIVAAGVWYATDILGERVPGPGLVAHFPPALEQLSPWREDGNRWVRRTVGISVHFWAKRSRGRADYAPQAEALLAFLEPLFADLDESEPSEFNAKTPGHKDAKTRILCAFAPLR